MVWVLGLTSRSDLLALFFIFGVLNLTNLDEKGGDTTTPLLSAECQIRDCEVFRPLISRVIAIFHKATNRLHFRDFMSYCIEISRHVCINGIK